MKIKMPLQNYLQECLIYEKGTGKLYWKIRPRKHFKTLRGWQTFNGRFAGQEAFTCLNEEGYRQGAINKITYYAHRIIWKLVTGNEPFQDVEHKDRVPEHNWWSNLREATRPQNNANSVTRKGYCLQGNRWRAYFTLNTKRIHLGYFATKQEAQAARFIAMKIHYGEFAPEKVL